MLHQVIAFLSDPANNFRGQTLATLRLSIIPTLVAILIALPLGVALAQRPLLAFISTNFSGLVRAIPTLGLLILVVPFLGVGARPALFALVLLGIPPILLNTIGGLRSIDPSTIEAARGMGMTQWQIFSRVQVPLMAPVLAAGVRTAAVQIVATVPLAAYIGAGGYGDYIFQGLDNDVVPPIIAGAVCIAIFALITELLLAWLQRALTPRGLRGAKTQTTAAEPEEATRAVEAPLAA